MSDNTHAEIGIFFGTLKYIESIEKNCHEIETKDELKNLIALLEEDIATLQKRGER